MTKARIDFDRNIEKALNNPFLQSALDQNAERRKQARSQGYASLPEGLGEVRKKAHEIKKELIENWGNYIEKFITKAKQNGFTVHVAPDAVAAQEIVELLIREAQAKVVVKSKTMVGEEIKVDETIKRAGAIAVETDLGEYIVQLRGEPPAHIITPAVHLRREEVAQTFTEKLGVPYNTDVKVMTEIARRNLRNFFINADVGISGVNFGVVETGSLCVLSNEGNARMVSTLPRLYIALLGVERLVPTLEDLSVFLRLLPRSATGQKITNYVSLIQSPRKENEADGSDLRHIILVDNGRKRIAETRFKEILYCIRCGACLNVCPVFREIGGHAYCSPYPGPIGAVLSPLLFGLERYGHLAKASSLCGACEEACPAIIPFSKLLPQVREQYVNKISQPLIWTMAMKILAWANSSSKVFGLFQKIASYIQPIFPRHNGDWTISLPLPLSGWTRSRDFPLATKTPFRQRWKKLEKRYRETTSKQDEIILKSNELPIKEYSLIQNYEYGFHNNREWLRDKFKKEWEALGGVFVSCSKTQFNNVFVAYLRENKINTLISWEWKNPPLINEIQFDDLSGNLAKNGITLIYPDRGQKNSKEYARNYDHAEAGMSGAIAAIADSGTIIVPSGTGMPLITSLLPRNHFVVMYEKDIFSSLEHWMKERGREIINNHSCVVLISGPSRTADIEMTLTIGVHGPEKVILFCINER